MSALKCRDKACHGVLVSVSPLNFRADWRCTTCGLTLSAEKVAVIQKVIAQELSNLDLEQPDSIMKYIEKTIRLVADSNHTILQFKYVLVRLLGYADGYEWQSRVSIQLLEIPVNKYILSAEYYAI